MFRYNDNLQSVDILPATNIGSGAFANTGTEPLGGATLEQAAWVKHYLRRSPFPERNCCITILPAGKKELVGFDAAESGMTTWFCARYENQKGECGKCKITAAALWELCKKPQKRYI
ncbi:MAG: hypothetical protein LBB78_12375 [Spirochaetaceae bacterium]|jgi:hypothetical protein|nr:hypothetical protein [Spirochaetaceae bacterium]